MKPQRNSHDWREWEATEIGLARMHGSLSRRILRYTWGLIFVCLMAAASQWGPRIGSHKTVDSVTTVFNPSFQRAVK